MRFPSLSEAQRYHAELPPSMYEIYHNGSTSYSGFRTVVLNREFSVPSVEYTRSGVLEEGGIIWWFAGCTLYFYSYENGTTDSTAKFSSEVLFVESFVPSPGIFNSKVRSCILVVTETDVILYAFDGSKIINTEFSARLRSEPRCIAVSGGRIYIGCSDGSVLQAIYQNIKIIGYRSLRLYSPVGFFQSMRNIFRRKPHPVIDISAGRTRLLALSNVVTVYDIEKGMYRLSEVAIEGEYARIQIIEDAPLVFCCFTHGGTRDFYTERGRFLRKDVPLSIDSLDSLSGTSSSLIVSNKRQVLFASTSSTSRLGIVSFNDYQLRNFSRVRPVENFEAFSLYAPIKALSLSASRLLVLSDTKLSIYSVLDSKRLLATCRPHELQELYRCYGDIEFMVRYYDMCSTGEDVSRMSGFCRNQNIRNYALFVFLYSLIEPVYRVDLSTLGRMSDPEASLSDSPKDAVLLPATIPGSAAAETCGSQEEDLNAVLDSIVSRMRTLKRHVSPGFSEAHNFIDEFIQTRYYVSLLVNYSVGFSETFESILMKEPCEPDGVRLSSGGSSFRVDTLRALLSTVSISQSIEPLLKVMKNRCPLYLPYEEINMRRGLEILRRGEGNYLQQSLECFLRAHFDRAVVKRYNEIGFFYGSVTLIREKFDFSYEEAVKLFRESVRCKKALDVGLGDSREAFLYPFFEAILSLEKFDRCCCCADQEIEVNLLEIKNPLFEVFLRDMNSKSIDSSDPRRYNMYWRYLLYSGKKLEAAEAMVFLAARPEIKFSEKLGLLEQALTVVACCSQQGSGLRQKIKRAISLAKIQYELSQRDPSVSMSRLLSADELFNDYCYNHPDLGIKVLDVVGYKDTRILRSLFSKYIESVSLNEAISFIAKLKNRNLALIIDLIAESPEADDKLLLKLENAGISRAEIAKAVDGAVSASASTRALLVRSLERISGRISQYSYGDQSCLF